MEALVILLNLLMGAVGLAAFVCYILVVIKMFQKGDQTMGLVSAIGFLVCGLGYLVAFVYGWMKAAEWDIKKIMLGWTACLLVNLAVFCIASAAIAMLGNNSNKAFGTVGASIGAFPGPGPGR